MKNKSFYIKKFFLVFLILFPNLVLSDVLKFNASEIELQNVILRAGFQPQRRDSDYVFLETPKCGHPVEELQSPPPIHSDVPLIAS